MGATFLCSSCGDIHDGPPFSYELQAPDYWYQIPREQHERRSELTSDLCVVDNEFFFIKGNLWMPVVNNESLFNLTVWASLSRHNFERTIDLWEIAGREKEPPFFGWLSNEISLYPGTLNLKVSVQTSPVGERPSITLEPTDHPLSLEQQQGITLDRVQQLAERVLHS